jgi:hypothetical protein
MSASSSLAHRSKTNDARLRPRVEVKAPWTGRGTHLGELQGIPPTGKRGEAPGSVFYRIVDGRIVNFRGQLEMMSLMQQLGVISSPQQAEV